MARVEKFLLELGTEHVEDIVCTTLSTQVIGTNINGVHISHLTSQTSIPLRNVKICALCSR